MTLPDNPEKSTTSIYALVLLEKQFIIYLKFVFVLFLPYDLNRRPLKTMIATSAEIAMVCPCGIRSTKAITNVIAAATAAIGIHILTADDVLSSVGCMVNVRYTKN